MKNPYITTTVASGVKWRKKVVVFHDTDADGLMGTTIAKSYFKNHKVEYRPFSYKKDWELAPVLDELPSDADCVLIDWSPSQLQIKQIEDYFQGNVYILDHHEATLALTCDLIRTELPLFTFDRCSAETSWMFFYPEVPMPLSVKLVGDRDTWRDPNNNMVACLHMAIYEKLDQDEWDAAVSMLDDTLPANKQMLLNADLHTRGLCQAFNKSVSIRSGQIRKIYTPDLVRIGALNGATIVYINCPYFLVSESCDQAIEEYGTDLAIGYSIQSDRVRLNFRSSGKANCNEIAKTFGGGGHAGASGAYCTLERLVELLNATSPAPRA